MNEQDSKGLETVSPDTNSGIELDPPQKPSHERGEGIDNSATMKMVGGNVKSVGDYSIQGYGIIYGGKDLYEETFTPTTDFGSTRSFIGLPVYYSHAQDGLKSQIGEVTGWSPDDEGILVDIEIYKRHKYAQQVMELVKQGALGLSTGALGHLAVIVDKTIKRWIVGEISVTPQPAEPRTFITAKNAEMSMAISALEHTDIHTKKDTQPMPDTTKEEATTQSASMLDMDKITDLIVKTVADALTVKDMHGHPVSGGGVIVSNEAPKAKKLTTKGFSNEPAEAFTHWVRTGDNIAAKAVLVEGTNDNGGWLVPTDINSTIIGRRDELSLLSQFPFMRMTTSRRQVDVPVQGAKSDLAIVAESGAANEDEPDFSNTRTITIYRHNVMMKISNELLSDEATNLNQFLTEEIARASARNINNYILNGTGSSQPYGILARASGSVDLATVAGMTYADVMSIMYSLPDYDEQGATGFVMKNATFGAIRGLTGNYPQFRPMVSGTKKDIDGYPTAVSDFMPAMGASNKSIIFGNMRYYAFVENASLEVSRNPYLYQANNQVGIFVNMRWGGDVTLGEAFTLGVHPAS